MALSRADLVREADLALRAEHCAVLALSASMSGAFRHVGTAARDGCQYAFSVAYLDAAHGGILVQRFRCRSTGQRDEYRPFYVEDWLRDYARHTSGYQLAFSPIATRLREMQRATLDLAAAVG